jgi:hypothetical protein
VEIGGEDGLEALAPLFEKLAEIVGIDMAEIECAWRGRGFPLAAHGQAAARRFG